MPIKRDKLNKLLQDWPSGAVYTTAWLKQNGYSPTLVDKYRRSEWLESVGRGAIKRKGDDVRWQGGVYALQKQLQLPVHVGGQSAFNVRGMDHFLALGTDKPLTLFAPLGTRLPQWFTEYKWDRPVTLVTTNLFTSDFELMGYGTRWLFITISNRARALFEMLYLVPKRQSIETAAQFMSLVATYRHEAIQQLLESCNSIKTKRLFMVLAEELEMPWVKKLDLSKVDFGQGPRTLIKGGKTHPRYLITLPPGLKLGEPN